MYIVGITIGFTYFIIFYMLNAKNTKNKFNNNLLPRTISKKV